MRTLGLLAAFVCLTLTGGCQLLFPFEVSPPTDASVDVAVDLALADDQQPPDATAPDAAPIDLAAADLPMTDLPGSDVNLTDAPLPDALLPDAPLPDAPLPDAPLPDAPLPDAPLPDLPPPDASLPDAPIPDAKKTNLALSATASSSGGGVNTVGPAKMNDGYLEVQCGTQFYHWVLAVPTAWIQLDWAKAVTIGSVWFDTSAPTGSCSVGVNRTLAGGKLEYWNGSSWTVIMGTTGKTADWGLTFTPVSTTRLRLYKVVAINPIFHPAIFEWEVHAK